MGEVAWEASAPRPVTSMLSSRASLGAVDATAALAVAHSLFVVIDHVLKTGQPYIELGVDYFDPLDATRVQRHHVRRLEQLGYTVTLTPIAV